jgi:hypothetical protein
VIDPAQTSVVTKLLQGNVADTGVQISANRPTMLMFPPTAPPTFILFLASAETVTIHWL